MARFTVAFTLLHFGNDGPRKDVPITASPVPTHHPDKVAAGVYIDGDNTKTDGNGTATLDLASFPGQYVIGVRDLPSIRISANQPDGTVLRYEDLVTEPALPPAAADLSGILSRLSALEAGGGTGSGSDALTVVEAGATVDLPNDTPVGTVLGFRLLGAATIEGVSTAAGVWLFERTTTGWERRPVAAGVPMGLHTPGDPDPDPGDPDPDPGDPGASGTATPQEPVWNDSAATFSIPTIEGVIYTRDGATITGEQASAPGQSVTITTTPAAGWTFPTGVASTWTHTFPAAAEWVTSFSDDAASPLGEVTARTGWTITNPSSGDDHATIDTSGLYFTGSASGRVQNPATAAKHSVACDYALAVGAWGGGGQVAIEIAGNGWGNHWVRLRPNDGTDSGCTLTTGGTLGWPDVTIEPGINLTSLPRAGHLHVECDGIDARVSIDSTLLLTGRLNADNTPASDGPPTRSAIAINGYANTAFRYRVTNIVMRTKA